MRCPAANEEVETELKSDDVFTTSGDSDIRNSWWALVVSSGFNSRVFVSRYRIGGADNTIAAINFDAAGGIRVAAVESGGDTTVKETCLRSLLAGLKEFAIRESRTKICFKMREPHALSIAPAYWDAIGFRCEGKIPRFYRDGSFFESHAGATGDDNTALSLSLSHQEPRLVI